MQEINKLPLKDLYELRRAWSDGIKVSTQKQYIKEGIQLRNNETGKDLLFTYNKTFDRISKKYMDYNYSDKCFINWTKSYTEVAKKAKYKMKSFNKYNDRFMVDGYPFERDQLCFLDNTFLGRDDEFNKFALAYVEEFIEYKEADGDNSNNYKYEIIAKVINGKMVYFIRDNKTGEEKPYKSGEQEMLQKENTKNQKQEGKIMNKITNIANTTMDINKDAIKLAAKLEVGKVATAQLKKVVKPKLPMMVRGYADSPLFDIVLANAVGIVLREYAKGNEKAQIVSEAMIQSAAVEMVSSFNINDMVNDMLENIDVSKITTLDKTEA